MFMPISESALLGDCCLWCDGLLDQPGDLSLAFLGVGPLGVRRLDRRSRWRRAVEWKVLAIHSAGRKVSNGIGNSKVV